MLISIDGHAAAGKSTQSHRIANHLGARRTNQYFKHLGDVRSQMMSEQLLKDKADLYFLFDLIKLKYAAQRTDYWLTKQTVVVDEFWLILWDRGVSKRYLEILKTFIQLPDISFYIHLSARESYIRKSIRTQIEKGIETDLSGEALNKKASQFQEIDKQSNTFWSWIEQVIPNVYLIDGMLSEDAVTQKMLEIIKNHDD